jgi:hypothetical protein
LYWSRKQYQPVVPGVMRALATERFPDCGPNAAVTGPIVGELHGAGAAVGPQAAKVTVPVGEPPAVLPVTVAVSTAELPREMLALLSEVVRLGVVFVPPPVTSTHSVEVSLSLTGL